jgi:hypothetical protein
VVVGLVPGIGPRQRRATKIASVFIPRKSFLNRCFEAKEGFCRRQGKSFALSQLRLAAGVARWYIFKPKIAVWVNFGGPWNGKGWFILLYSMRNILRPFGIFYGHLVGIFFSFLV